MDFGYFTLTDNPPRYEAQRRDPNRFLQEVEEEAIAAEELGFHSAWVPEHHFGLFGCLPAPATFLAHLAARTSRIKLAAATVVLPCNHPIRVAEEWALLDLLSNGRTLFCAGRGYDRREYDTFEVPFEESRGRFDEEMAIVRAAWTQTDLTWEGQYHRWDLPITVLPRPVQQPHPPIYVACFSEPTMRMAAAGEFNIIFAPFAASVVFGGLQAAAARFFGFAREAGFPHLRAKCSYFLALADTPAEQLRAKERLKFYQRGVRGASPTQASAAPASYAYFEEIAKRNAASTAETLGEETIITGSPAQVIEQLKRVEAAGIDEVICYFNYGALPHTDTLRQMERFAAEVMPAFAAVPQAAGS